MPEAPVEGGQAAGLELGVVGVGADDQQPQRIRHGARSLSRMTGCSRPGGEGPRIACDNNDDISRCPGVWSMSLSTGSTVVRAQGGSPVSTAVTGSGADARASVSSRKVTANRAS